MTLQTTHAAALRGLADKIAPLNPRDALVAREVAGKVDNLDTFIRRDKGSLGVVGSLAIVVNRHWHPAGDKEALIRDLDAYTRELRDTMLTYVEEQFNQPLRALTDEPA